MVRGIESARAGRCAGEHKKRVFDRQAGSRFRSRQRVAPDRTQDSRAWITPQTGDRLPPYSFRADQVPATTRWTNCCHVQYSSLFVFWVAYRTRSRRRQTDGPAGEFLRREPTGDRPCALRGIGVSEPEVPQTHCDRALAWPGNNFRRRSSAERGGQPANGPVAFREVIGGDRL